MSCGVGRRHGSGMALLWLWGKPTAVALIQPLAWELPYAIGAALKEKKKKDIIVMEVINTFLGMALIKR